MLYFFSKLKGLKPNSSYQNFPMFETTLKKNVWQLKNLKFIPRQIILSEVMNKFLKCKKKKHIC